MYPLMQAQSLMSKDESIDLSAVKVSPPCVYVREILGCRPHVRCVLACILACLHVGGCVRVSVVCVFLCGCVASECV